MKKLILIISAGFVLALSACSTIDATRATSAGIKALQAATISDREVQQYVSQYIAQLDEQNTILTGSNPYAQRLDRLTSSFNNRNGINIKVYKGSDANAFSTADGSVRVYTGLMDIMNDEELLGVIGHEIGHVINHDTRDQFRNALITSALRDGIASTGGVAAVLTSSQLGDVAEAVSQSQYSQKQEHEADVYGYNFLVQHGINPWAMAMSFERLRELQNGASYGGLQQLLSTHPDLDSRIRAMSQMAERDGYRRPTDGNFRINNSGAKTINTNNGGSGTSDKWVF